MKKGINQHIAGHFPWISKFNTPVEGQTVNDIYAASTCSLTFWVLFTRYQLLQGCEVESNSSVNLEQNTCLLAKGLICWTALDKISSFLVCKRKIGWLSNHHRKAFLPRKYLWISAQLHLFSKFIALKMRWQRFASYFFNKCYLF